MNEGPDDSVFTWCFDQKHDQIVATTLGPVPYHEIEWLNEALGLVLIATRQALSNGAFAQIEIHAAVNEKTGGLQLNIPGSYQYWFSPGLVEEKRSMVWDGLRTALLGLDINSCPSCPPLRVHGSIDFRSVCQDGTLIGHYLEYFRQYVCPPVKGVGLLIGDPRFAAPELFRGELPTTASDIFAVAAVYCARNSTPPALASLPRTRDESYGMLPKDRVNQITQNADGEQKRLLLSLLDDDPVARLLACDSIMCTGGATSGGAVRA
ncbi:MAG: hypothetical protein FWD57_10325 [Polyangiaceae bacterium]|nr:hypothetical protein [Polyangiaceae bacterium]